MRISLSGRILNYLVVCLASLTQTMNSSWATKSGFPFADTKDVSITQSRKSAPPTAKFALSGSMKPMSDLSYEINTNTNYPNIFGDYVPKNPQTAITEGQFVAWYSNDELVGSGVIS